MPDEGFVLVVQCVDSNLHVPCQFAVSLCEVALKQRGMKLWNHTPRSLKLTPNCLLATRSPFDKRLRYSMLVGGKVEFSKDHLERLPFVSCACFYRFWSFSNGLEGVSH